MTSNNKICIKNILYGNYAYDQEQKQLRKIDNIKEKRILNLNKINKIKNNIDVELNHRDKINE
jgi:hypothetical protein